MASPFVFIGGRHRRRIQRSGCGTWILIIGTIITACVVITICL